MLREKEELMLRLQDYEQKTKRAEKGQGGLLLPALPPPHPTPELVPPESRAGLAHSQDGTLFKTTPPQDRTEPCQCPHWD